MMTVTCDATTLERPVSECSVEDPEGGRSAFSLALARVESPLRDTTVLASLKARSIFFARELRHGAKHHDPDHPLRVLELGGDGRELAEFLLDSRGYTFVDAALVSSDVCSLGCAVQYAFRLDDGVRFQLDARDPLSMLHDAERSAWHDRDLVFVPTLLDFVSDAQASRVLDRVLRHLRPGGIMVAATFDDGIPCDELDLAAEVIGTRPHPRSASALEALRRGSELACHENVRVLERGPNRYLLLRRRPTA